jgi:hypothetical protein
MSLKNATAADQNAAAFLRIRRLIAPPPPPPPPPAAAASVKRRTGIVESETVGGRADCASQKGTRADQDSPPNAAIPFIDHSSEMWNFRCDRAYPLSSFQVRKVKP